MIYNESVDGCLIGKDGSTCKINSGYYRYKGKAAHRIIWEIHNGPIPRGMLVDHKDRNPLNNRIENLRLATRGQNTHNSIRRKKDGLPPGVCFSCGKYRVTFTNEGVTYKEKFLTLEEAVAWRRELGERLAGEFFVA